MLAQLAEAIVRRARPLGVLALIIAVAAGIYGSGVARVLAPGGFEVAGGEAEAVATLVSDRFGFGTPDIVALVDLADTPVGDPAMDAELVRLRDSLQEHPAVADVQTPLGPAGAALTSRDGKTAMVTISLRGSAADREAAFAQIEALVAAVAHGTVRLGGPVAVAVIGQRTAEHDLVRAELVAFPLVALLLIVFFGGRVAALLPLAVGGLSIAMATTVLRALANLTDISVFALNIVTLLGLGLAIDYSLFIVQRFREELPFGTVREAVVRTVVSAGKTTLFSGVAVAVSLLALLVFPIALLHSIAIAGAVIVLLTVATSLVALPAALAWIGRGVDWPRGASKHVLPQAGHGWGRVAQWVMRHAKGVTAATVLGLLALSWPASRLETALSDARIFPADFDVRAVQSRVNEPAGFAAGDTAEYWMVLQGDGSVLEPDALGRLYDTHQALLGVPGVQHVDDLVGTLPHDDRAQFIAAAGAVATAADAPPELARLVDRNVTLVRVQASAPVGAPARADQVDALRQAGQGWRQVQLGGPPAVEHEVDEALLAGAVPAALIVVAVTLLVLTLAFGAIVVAVKAVLMNVLSLTASFGALVWIFQDGHLEWLLDYHSIGTIDPLVMLVMFSIVFGLSMDYELFLLSRIREDYEASGDAHASVTRGLAASGRLITMAGLMLIVVLVGFASADVLFVKQLGVGMAIAVALDATVVRGLLVPATMRLLGRWNWWAAGWYTRWWTRWNIGIRELPPGTPVPSPAAATPAPETPRISRGGAKAYGSSSP